MRYVHITRSPGQGLREYRAVLEHMGGEPPDGLLISLVGEAEGALHVVDVWESKAHADRFVAERLFPAFQRTGQGPGADSTYVAFETDDIFVKEPVR